MHAMEVECLCEYVTMSLFILVYDISDVAGSMSSTVIDTD
jgi:hypothetical protein